MLYNINKWWNLKLQNLDYFRHKWQRLVEVWFYLFVLCTSFNKQYHHVSTSNRFYTIPIRLTHLSSIESLKGSPAFVVQLLMTHLAFYGQYYGVATTLYSCKTIVNAENRILVGTIYKNNLPIDLTKSISKLF